MRNYATSKRQARAEIAASTGLISEEIGKLEGRVNKEAKTNAPRDFTRAYSIVQQMQEEHHSERRPKRWVPCCGVGAF